MKEVFKWCSKLGVTTITFYLLSLENIGKRPKREINYIYSLIRKELKDVINNKHNFVHKNKIKMSFFGNIHLLPNDLQGLIGKTSKITSNYSNYTINFAVAYGGRQEMINACVKIGKQIQDGKLTPEEITESLLRQNLMTNGAKDPDLIIRTGGEKRLSNFLLFQSSYSELAFIDTLWPEVTKKEFTEVIEDFKARDRRFGK